MRHGPATTTIADLMADPAGWWQLCCTRSHCRRVVASDLKVFAAKWGADASSDMIREKARCSVCGQRGVELTHPSYMGRDQGWAKFPGEGVEISESHLDRKEKILPTPPARE